MRDWIVPAGGTDEAVAPVPHHPVRATRAASDTSEAALFRVCGGFGPAPLVVVQPR
jgi:hypothetical protein